MIGAGGSGKTALVNRFLTQKFSEQYIVTIGSQFAVKTVTVNNSADEPVVVKLLVWDLAGQARYLFLIQLEKALGWNYPNGLRKQRMPSDNEFR